MFRRRLPSRLRLNYSIHLTVILTVLTSLGALGSVGVTTGTAGGMVPTAFTVAPTNDNFANAQPILGASGIILGNNVGATKEPNEANHAGRTGGASVWYRWQAPFDGTFVFTTFNTGFETVLAVYTGNSLPGPATLPVKANDVEPFGCGGGGTFSFPPPSSRVAFPAVGGVVYHIAIDIRSSSNTPGNIQLRWGRSASITGGIRDVSNRPTPSVGRVELLGDVCRVTEVPGAVSFHEVPANGNYEVIVNPPTGQIVNYGRFGTTDTISPLTGDVTNYHYVQLSPTKSISGTVTIPGGDTSGITVRCVAVLFSQQARDLGGGRYQCSSLPVNGDYVVTPSKLGYTFEPVSDTIRFLLADVFSVNFAGSVAPPQVISGRVTNAAGTSGLSGITVNLSGLQTASQVTDTNGNYSFTGLVHGGNYTVTPSHSNFAFNPLSLSFTNVTAAQTANFTASFLLQLALDDAGQVVALDSMLHLTDPFLVINQSNVLNRGVDRNTRVAIFVTNFSLLPGESASAVVINLIGSNNQSYDIPAEDVRPLANTPYTQIIFRLPDSLTAGTSTLVVKGHGLTSNIGSMKIN